MSLAEIAAASGKSLSQIKRMSIRYPVALRKMVDSFLDGTREARESSDAQLTNPTNEPEHEESNDEPAAEFSAGLGLSAAIQRFREAEKLAADNYAKVANKSSRAPGAMSVWIMAADQLRKIEKDNPEIAKANEKSLDADEVQREWSKLINEFRTALEAVPQRMAIVLEGLDAIAIQEKLEHEMRQVMGVLSGSAN